VRYLNAPECDDMRAAARDVRSSGSPVRLPKSRLEETIDRAESEFQRMALIEWGKRNPLPARINAGYLGWLDVVPTLCYCTECRSPSLIIPDPAIVPARGFVLCPNCSMAVARVTSPQSAESK